MDRILQLASGNPGFFDQAFLYISGGALVVLALGVAFLGLRREDFPTSTQLRVLSGTAVLLVICTGIGALNNARFEQSERREKNNEAATEAAAEEAAKEQALTPETEAQGAVPGSASGEASSPNAQGGGAAAGIDGKALFVDSGCGDCHTLADAGTAGQIGPALDQVLPGQTSEMIRTSIVDPGATVEQGFADGVMPAVYGEQFTGAELDALVAYLAKAAGK